MIARTSRPGRVSSRRIGSYCTGLDFLAPSRGSSATRALGRSLPANSAFGEPWRTWHATDTQCPRSGRGSQSVRDEFGQYREMVGGVACALVRRHCLHGQRLESAAQDPVDALVGNAGEVVESLLG